MTTAHAGNEQAGAGRSRIGTFDPGDFTTSVSQMCEPREKREAISLLDLAR